ncbi:RNA methyltransferase [Saprospiraceae bacterium]|nr:RNA methyltransferase [Saprospiraceae bacterium]
MTVILENVHDPHNIGAVMRSCDAIGIQEVYVLTTDPRIQRANAVTFKPTSTGVRKWLYLHHYNDVDKCFADVKSKYDNVLATHINSESESLYDMDLTGNIAFLFGNEHEGISEEALKYANANFLIPQYGMVQSLNISVACALTIFEAGRQRLAKGMYSDDISQSQGYNGEILKHFRKKHEESYRK